MKKIGCMIVSGLLLTALLASPAAARTTSVDLDGKNYVFWGDEATFKADGKTFIVGDDSVRVQEPGKADRVLPLETAEDIQTTVDIMPGSDASAQVYDGVVITESAEGAEFSMFSGIAEEGMIEEEPTYEEYEKYGLRYDAIEKRLYFNGERVRIFEDGYALGEGGYCAIGHFDEGGTVDVSALRDLSKRQYNPDGSYDPSGELTGLRPWSDAEFAARDIGDWTNPEPRPSTAISSGDPMTAQEKQEFFAPYAELGLSYDAATDQLFYHGQTVREFVDVFRSNGEQLSGGYFQGSMTQMTMGSGEIDVTILRDYDDPDALGNGRITGVRVEEAK